MKKFINIIIYILFFICSYSIDAIEDKKLNVPSLHKKEEPCSFGYIYVDSNEHGSGGGHTAILLDQFVYHFQRVFDTFFILDKSEFTEFIFNYSRIQNRNINLLCIQDKFDINFLKDQLEYIHKKNQFYVYNYLYYQNLKKSYRTNQYYLPTLLYFDFDEKEWINFLEHSEFDVNKWENLYNFDIVLNTLEYFYKFIKIKNSSYNKKYFIKIQHQFDFSVLKNKVHRYLDDWQKQDALILENPNADSYLALLESKIYQYTLYNLIDNKIYLPLLTIKYENGQLNPLILENSTIDLEHFPQNYYSNIYLQLKEYLQLLLNGIEENESLYSIQFYLKQITFLANQLILLENKKNIFDANIGILKTPQLYYQSKLLNQSIQKQLKNTNYIEYLNNKIDSIEQNQKDIFEYNLIFKNCVTELLKLTYEHSNSEPIKQVFTEINTKTTLKGKFIPFLSFIYLKDIIKKYNISYKVYYYSSFRNELLKQKNISRFKEISTLTSDAYYFNANDSFFLFFTEDQLILRPVLGVVNTLSSLGKISFDLIVLPYDYYKDNINISKELRGLFFSFSEVVFVSIRKGTFLSPQLHDQFKLLFFSMPKQIVLE